MCSLRTFLLLVSPNLPSFGRLDSRDLADRVVSKAVGSKHIERKHRRSKCYRVARLVGATISKLLSGIVVDAMTKRRHPTIIWHEPQATQLLELDQANETSKEELLIFKFQYCCCYSAFFFCLCLRSSSVAIFAFNTARHFGGSLSRS